LVYFFIYTVRVKGWTFGFSTLFGALGRVVEKVKALFNRKERTGDKMGDGK
jgi:ATP-binding cassette, subfamily G (WHITE), member 2, SNQ2